LADGVNLNLTYKGVKELENLRVIVDVKAGREGAMKWQALLKNDSQMTIKVRLIFPLLDGLNLGDRVGWFFPQRGGAVSELPLEGLASYGGMAWLQVLDIYKVDGGGIYVRCDDTQGIYKIFSLRWSPKEDISPRRVADIPEPAHPVDAWRAKAGAHLSIQYLPSEIEPGKSVSFLPTT